MKRSTRAGRRRFLIAAGVLGMGGAGAWLAGGRAPLPAMPLGWYLVYQPDPAGDTRLVVRDAFGRAVRELERGVGSVYLAAVASPGDRYLAVLKRVPRGSMPSDAIALYDRRTLREISETEFQIDFQELPSYTLSWSADAARLAVPYDQAAQTLLFGVRGGQVRLQAVLRRARFRFHPTRPDVALLERDGPSRGGTSVVRLRDDARPQELEAIDGRRAEWSPDGRWLSYLTGSRGQGTQRLVVRDEATRRTVASIAADARVVEWAPGGRFLAAFARRSRDPLGFARLVPAGLVPGWPPRGDEPALLVFDTAERRSTTIGGFDPAFQLVRLQWMGDDWLLALGARAAHSLHLDRRGERRSAVTQAGDFAPLLAWLPAPR